MRELFGGRQVEDGPFRLRVEATELGDFRIDVDSGALRDRRYLEVLEGMGLALDHSQLDKPLDTLVGWLAELVIPFEVTTPPIPLGELARVDELRAALAERKARGTGSRLRYAFGLHLNPEAPSLETESVLRHLRAFLLLYERLAEEAEIDLTRRITPFIDEFPAAYRRRVLDPDYAPSFEELAADYMAHNPTRNRALDLLPLLAHRLGAERLEGLPEDEHRMPRPTYHYRLPDCRLDEPGWTVAEEWNRWLEVERLAARPDELARRCEAKRPAPSGLPSFWRRLRRRAKRLLKGERR